MGGKVFITLPGSMMVPEAPLVLGELKNNGTNPNIKAMIMANMTQGLFLLLRKNMVTSRRRNALNYLPNFICA
jgi:hypothetical protein